MKKLSTELKEVLTHLEQAQAKLVALSKKAAEARQYGTCGDLQHVTHQIVSIISTDHGEAGLEPLIEMLEERGE